MINFQAPAPAYMLRQNGQTVFAQPAGGAIFTSPMYPSQRGGMNGLGSFDASAPRDIGSSSGGLYVTPTGPVTMYDPNCGVLTVAVLPGESNQQAYERTRAAWAAKYGHLIPAPNESEKQARCRMETAYRQAQYQAAQQQAAAQQLALHQQHGTMFAPQSTPAPTLVDPAWQQSLRIAPTYAAAQPMMLTDAQMLQAQQMAAGTGSGMQIVNTSPSLAPSPASLSPVAPFQPFAASLSPVAPFQPFAAPLSPVAPFQPFAAPIQHSDPMAAAREEIAQREAEAAAREEIAQREAEAAAREEIAQREAEAAAREEIAQREAEAAGILFDRPIDGGDVLTKLAKEKYEREAQQRHQAFLAQEAAAEEARRQLAANAPPVAQSNTLLWVGLGAAAFGVAWWMMSGKGAAA